MFNLLLKNVNIIFNPKESLDWFNIITLVISVFALGISILALYFQYWQKSTKVIFNQLNYHNDDNPLIMEIVLSNSGNTEVLITDLWYSFDMLEPGVSSLIKISHVQPRLPILVAPRDIIKLHIEHYINALLDDTNVYELRNGRPNFKINLIVKSIRYDGVAIESTIPLMILELNAPGVMTHHSKNMFKSNGKNIFEKRISVATPI